MFVITNAGLAAVAAATPTGPYVEIVAFKLGSDSSTTPLVTDVGLAGATVYSGVPSSYSYYDATTVQINCEVPASAGPFNYGEIGLYLPGDVLFARFSYGALRSKVESSGSGYANTLRIKALLRLAQGPSIFNFDTAVSQTILEIASLSLLQTPADNPQNPVVIVHEPNDYQESILCYKHSGTLWDIANYTKIGVATVTAASDTTHITATFFGTLHLPASSLGKYIIQTQGGYLRTISGLSGNIATLAASYVTAGLIGQTVGVYQADVSRLNELSSSVGVLQSSLASLDLYLGSATLSGSNYTMSTGGSGNPPEIFSVTFASANPVSATLNVNSTGNRNLLSPDGSALPANVLAAGETRTVVFNGTNYIVQAYPGVVKVSDFTGANQLVANPGYQKMPGGMILQWGSRVVGNALGGKQSATQSFPISFPTTCLQVMFSLSDSSAYCNIIQGFISPTTSNFVWHWEETGSSNQNATLYYLAIGY